MTGQQVGIIGGNQCDSNSASWYTTLTSTSPLHISIGVRHPSFLESWRESLAAHDDPALFPSLCSITARAVAARP